jgi:hypothetical protein
LEHLRPIQKNYYAAKNDSRYNSKNAVVFDAHYTTFESRADQVQSFFFGSMGIGFSLWLILLLFPKINALNLKRLLKGEPLKQTP